jgi:CcmD family protein
VDTGAWLAVALAAVALGIGGYVASLIARRRRLEERLDRLQHDDPN